MLKYLIVLAVSVSAMAQTPNVIPLTPDEAAQWKQSEKWVQEDQNKLTKDETDEANLHISIVRKHKLPSGSYYEILDDKYLVKQQQSDFIQYNTMEGSPPPPAAPLYNCPNNGGWTTTTPIPATGGVIQ